MADTVAWVRHYNRWQRWPFSLLTSADKCLPQAQRASIGRRLSGACLFCLDEYCGQRVVSQMVNPEREVFEEKWQCALYEIADMLNLQSDRVERKAGHNKAIFSKQVQADYFTAKSMLVDVQANARALARGWRPKAECADSKHVPAKLEPCFNSLEMWYHNFASRRDKEAGEVFNPAAAEYHKRIREELDSLQPVERKKYVELMIAQRKAHHASKRFLASVVKDSPLPVLEDCGPQDVGSILDTLFVSHGSVDHLQRTKHGEVVPLKENVYKSFCKRMQQEKCASMLSHAQSWATGNVPFGRDAGKVPVRCSVREQCGAICQTREPKRRAVANKMLEKLRAAVRGVGKTSIRRLEFLFVIESRIEGEGTQCKFGMVNDILGAGVEGVQKPDICIMDMEHLRGICTPPFKDCCLKFGRHEFVETQGPHGVRFRKDVTRGRWKHHLGDQFMDLIVASEDAVGNSIVTTHILDFVWDKIDFTKLTVSGTSRILAPVDACIVKCQHVVEVSGVEDADAECFDVLGNLCGLSASPVKQPELLEPDVVIYDGDEIVAHACPWACGRPYSHIVLHRHIYIYIYIYIYGGPYCIAIWQLAILPYCAAILWV